MANTFFSRISIRVGIDEQILFARHLSVMAKAGLPLIESLTLIRKETKSKSMAKILDQTIADVGNGQFLSDSLSKFQNIFGSLFINIIRIGESAGILSENLNYLADELRKKRELKSKVIGALIYPAVIFCATFGITGLLLVFIFPKILPVFSSLKIDLPVTTRALIWISNALTNYGPIMAAVAAALIVALALLLKIKKIKYFALVLLLNIPIFGKIFRNVNLANFCRTLGLTLKSGIKVVEAITITANSLSNLVYQKIILDIAEEVRRGGAIAPYLVKNHRLFPIIVSQMVSVGETAGNLSETLLYLSDFYEGEVGEATKNLSTVLEPFLMVMMGVMVGFMALSIITPIYEVSQNVGNR